MKSKRKIYIYTSLFPYSLISESFLSTELEIIKGQFDITIVPISYEKISRKVPNTIVVDDSICKCSFWYKLKCFFSIFSFTTLKLIFSSKEFKYIKRFPIDLIKYLYGAYLVYYDVCKKIGTDSSACFYSYWYSYPPIAFSLYKYRHPGTNAKFISRAHGSDVYGVEVGVYYPLRNFVAKYIDDVFCVSSYGMNYLKAKNALLTDKLHLSRLGVINDYGITKETSESIHLLSCARVMGLKRLPLIFQSVAEFATNNTKSNIIWTHIGDGPDMQSLESVIKTSSIPNNLTVELKGNMPNELIKKYYHKNHIDCFLLLSSSEGIPVSIMEAISFGVPVLATRVGGVSEIVSDEVGLLLDVDFKQSEFDEALSSIIANREKYRNSTYLFYEQNYNAQNNYLEFYENIGY